MRVIYRNHPDEEKFEQLIRKTYGDGRLIDHIELTNCEIYNIGSHKFRRRKISNGIYSTVYQGIPIKIVGEHANNKCKEIEQLMILSNRIVQDHKDKKSLDYSRSLNRIIKSLRNIF